MTDGYKVEYLWNETKLNRMKDALHTFWKDTKSISEYLYNKILGYYQEKELFM